RAASRCSRRPRVLGSSGSIAPMRSIHTAVLTLAIAAPPEAVAFSAQSWLTYQVAPTNGLSRRLLQSAGALDEGRLEELTTELLELATELGVELVTELMLELDAGTLEIGVLETLLLDTTLELLELTGVLLTEDPPPTMP